MKAYLNTKMYGTTETLTELSLDDFKSLAEYRAEKKRLLSEYTMSGHGSPYWSSRPTRNWNN